MATLAQHWSVLNFPMLGNIGMLGKDVRRKPREVGKDAKKVGRHGSLGRDFGKEVWRKTQNLLFPSR